MKQVRWFLFMAGLLSSLQLLQAQTTQPDSIVQITAESQGLQQIAFGDLPIIGGTYWEVLPGGATLPLPAPMFDPTLPIYSIAGDIYLVDASGGQLAITPRQTAMLSTNATALVQTESTALANLIEQVQAAQAPSTMAMMTMSTMDSPAPPGFGDSGTNSYSPDGLTNSYSAPDYGTNLWIANPYVAAGQLNGIGTNTLADIQYDILSRTNLMQTDWQFEGSIWGSEITNWTPLSVAQNGRTNLFLRLRSDASSTGSGIPDWWELQYFGTTGIDPNANPMGDGWSNIQKYQNGMNPNVFYTPAAPQDFTAAYDPVSGLVNLSWQPSLGQVTSYTVYKTDYTSGITTNFILSASATSLSDNLSADVPNDVWNSPNVLAYYSVKASYGSHGSSAWSPNVQVESAPSSISLISDSQGTPTLVMPTPPPGSTALRLKRVDFISVYVYNNFANNIYYTIPLSSSTNGLYPIPAAWLTPDTDPYGFNEYTWWVQTVDANTNATSSFQEFGHVWGNQFQTDRLVPPVFAGQTQLKQNLIFQLRAATVDAPLTIQEYDPTNNNQIFPIISNTPAYGCSSFYNIQAYDQGNGVTAYQPSVDSLTLFTDNYLYRNLVYNSSDVDSSGALTTGVDYSQETWGVPTGIQLPGTYRFQIPATNQTPIPALLPTNTTEWFHITPFGQSTFFDNMGLTFSFDSSSSLSTYTLPSNTRNWFGLPIVSLLAYYTDPSTFNQDTAVIASGHSLVTYDQPPTVYFQTAQPQFQTVEYDFWQANAYPITDGNGNLVANDVPLPGMPYFSPTNASQRMFMAVGSSLQIAGYAKLAVQNGYSGVYGYLGQYFDKAYKMTNGVASSTTTGILSPYGQFFATEPGPAALVTVPDPDTGARGTCPVYAYSIVLDRNQSSNMDLTFNGANATSLGNPMILWCNDNYDRGHTVDGSDFEQDDLSLAEIANLNVPSEQKVSDCQYKTNGYPAIPCTRDLEDYFRMWTPGIAALMKTLPLNYSVQFALTGAGQIRIFQAIETNGGTNYLFDETTASNQVAYSTSLYVGLLTSNSPVMLPVQTNFNEHFIFCGAQRGSAQIDLQILDGNQNVVGDAPAYLQIKNIKEMYERWTVGDVPTNMPAAVAVADASDLPTNPPVKAFTYPAPQNTNTPYILYVHGWNMDKYDKDRYAEAAYKRLYWQGYRGRFGIFRWPTGNGFSGIISALTDSRNYDNSEFTAWQSAVGLTNLLTQLNAQYPAHVYVMAHSMGNVVTGEALRLANTQLVKTYIAMQGAVPAHCYDSSTTNRSTYSTPDRYAHYYTDSSPSYFSSSAGAGTYVNFYNTNDYALGWWNVDQAQKPDNGLGGIGVNYPGYFYSSSSGFYKIAGSQYNLNFLANTYEIFAYADPSWSYALGAEAGITTFTRKLNLITVWPTTDPHPGHDYSAHVWHSAEFRSDFPSRAGNWNAILGGNGFNLK